MVSFHCQDGISTLLTLQGVSLVFVDPPWMAGDRKSGEYAYKDSYPLDEYVSRFCIQIVAGAERALVDGGTLAVWVDFRAAPYWGVAMDRSSLARCGEVIIESGLGNPGRSKWPMKHSNIILAYKGAVQKFNVDALPMVPRLSAPKRVGETVYAGDKRVASVLRHTLSNTDSERCGYPDQKPWDICKIVVEAFTVPGDLVVDPCCGSGSIPIAAHLSGRSGIGYDISYKAIMLSQDRARRTCQ